MEVKVNDIVKTKVIGIQHYGIFVKLIDNEDYTGLIHISEVSYDFVKNIYDFANVDDIIYAKVLDIDEPSKKIKLSIKATNKVRYKTNGFVKYHKDPRYSDFTTLKNKLPDWIKDELKGISEND